MAIIASSSVGMTRTSTRLVGRLMIAADWVLASASRLTPNQPNLSQILARTEAACSPIPAVKTIPSNPPSE